MSDLSLSAGLTEALPCALVSPNATIIVVGTTITSASPMAVALLNASDAAQIVGRSAFDFVAPCSLGAAQGRNRSIRAGSAPRPEQISILDVNGVEILADIASTPIIWQGVTASEINLWPVGRSDDGRPDAGSEPDIGIADSVIVTDANHRVQSFNQAAERLYGWLESEVLGVPVHEAIPLVGDVAQIRSKLKDFYANGRWHGQTLQRRRDGTVVAVFTSATLMRDADGRHLGAVFINRPLGSTRTLADWPLFDQIRRGIDRDEFTVFYQPIVILETAAVVGVEALVRWQHPELGLLPPAAFIGTAEQSGLIIDVGDAVLAKACRQAKIWRDHGHTLRVSVNLASRQIVDPMLPIRLAELIHETQLPPGTLSLEITETGVVDDLDLASACLHRLRDLGARTSIDDFGTGWNSLQSLHSLPVDELKIDRSFVSGLGVRANDTAIVTSIIRLGRDLGATVVAEGIETEAQRQMLLELGCTIGQGFLFGRPAAADRLDI